MMPIAAMRMRKPWSPLQLPSIHAAYDPTDPSKLWQDAARTVPVTSHNDPVWAIDDITGNGHHLYAPNSTGRGLWQSTVGILVDGVDDWYYEVAGVTLTIPIYIAAAYTRAVVSAGGSDMFEIWGNTTNFSVLEAAGGDTGRSRFRMGGTGQQLIPGGLGEWPAGAARVIDGLHLPGTSDVQVNNNTKVTASNGYAAGVQLLGGRIGVTRGGVTPAAAGMFHGGIVALADPGAMRANAKGWLAARAGITL